jgi:hypothetical protein
VDRNVKHARILIAAFGVALICSSAYAGNRKPVGAAKAGKKTGPVANNVRGNVPTGGSHLTGGPDGFGYYYMDQAEALLDYSWVDISGTGSNIVSGDEGSATANLTDPFTFYGVSVTSLNMSTNGYLSTSTTDPGTDDTNDCPLPATPDLGGGARMYPLHDDLVTGAGYVEYFADCPRDNTLGIDGGGATEDCTVFQWDDTNHFGSTATFTFDFETVLYHDSGVVVHQIADDNLTGALSTTGIQQDQSIAANGIEYACNTAGSIPASTAVAFYVCLPISIAPATLPAGTCETPYSQQLTATGGTAPYAYAVTAGTLPTGLTLSATGLLSGSPVAPGGTFTFTVTATDAKGCTGSQQYTVTINCGPPPEIVADCLWEGTEGSPYSFTLSANGGTPPYTWSTVGGTLPPGITLSAAGVLSGTPTAAGTYTFTVQVTDAVGGSGQLQFVLFIGEDFDILVGSGLGFSNPNEVRIFDETGTATAVDYLAYAANQWGTNVASGNVGNGPQTDVTSAEIITGPGPGGVYGPHVRGWFRDGSQLAKINFFAYGTLRYGVNVSSGNVDGDLVDSWDEIVTGAGPGDVFGPHVRGWNYDNLSLQPINKINFFAYGTLKYGVNVAEGDVDNDAFCADEMVTGAGPAQIFAAQVRGWNYDGVTLSQIAKINFNAFSTNYGVNVSAGDIDGTDWYAEIAAAQGPAPTNQPLFSGFNYDNSTVTPLPGFSAYTPASFSGNYGGRVGLGDITGDGGWDLLAGQGRDPLVDSEVCVADYTGSALNQVICFNAMPATQTYGINPAGGKFGY